MAESELFAQIATSVPSKSRRKPLVKPSIMYCLCVKPCNRLLSGAILTGVGRVGWVVLTVGFELTVGFVPICGWSRW